MQDTKLNISTNREHYDHNYAQVNAEALVAQIRDLKRFFDDATKTSTSWHGFYHGGFAERLGRKRVLELGCGDGLNALIMASFGAEVVAVDISHESGRILREASCELQIEGLCVIVGDFATIPFEPHSFDFVVGKAFLHHLTHDLEDNYVAKAACLLKPCGEARFFEPAVNSRLLDALRWMIPVPGRPSILMKRRFRKWKELDPHPERDNSSDHFRRLGTKYFDSVDIVPVGSLERLCRLMPQGSFNRGFRRWAHRAELWLPMYLRMKAARSQLIVFRRPRHSAESSASVH
ncbi:MAG: class I SAM-dependent methyltransferase [Bryobacterales bacterium]|nr:class I SAM-dependent methyltransferase [Bryobacterales bacterium]